MWDIIIKAGNFIGKIAKDIELPSVPTKGKPVSKYKKTELVIDPSVIDIPKEEVRVTDFPRNKLLFKKRHRLDEEEEAYGRERKPEDVFLDSLDGRPRLPDVPEEN